MWEIFSYGQKPCRSQEFSIVRPNGHLDGEELLRVLRRGTTMSAPKQIFIDEDFQEKMEDFFQKIMRYLL